MSVCGVLVHVATEQQQQQQYIVAHKPQTTYGSTSSHCMVQHKITTIKRHCRRAIQSGCACWFKQIYTASVVVSTSEWRKKERHMRGHISTNTRQPSKLNTYYYTNTGHGRTEWWWCVGVFRCAAAKHVCQ